MRFEGVHQYHTIYSSQYAGGGGVVDVADDVLTHPSIRPDREYGRL